MRLAGTGAGVLLALCAAPALAAELRDLVVDKNDGTITVRSVTFMAAPIDGVFDVLTDYDRFNRVSKLFVESRFLERQPNGNGVIYTVAKGCVAFFCRTMERVESLEVDAPTTITTTVIPEGSDLKAGVSRWDLQPVKGGTEVIYQMEMVPDFWVPPLIGTYVLKRSLAKEGARAAQRIEELALGNDLRQGKLPADSTHTHE